MAPDLNMLVIESKFPLASTPVGKFAGERVAVAIAYERVRAGEGESFGSPLHFGFYGRVMVCDDPICFVEDEYGVNEITEEEYRSAEEEEFLEFDDGA